MDKYDVAVMMENPDVVFEAVDIFGLGGRQYAVMLRQGSAIIVELIALNGVKLEQGLNDYCFMATFTEQAQREANRRLEQGLPGEGYTAIDVAGMRSLADALAERGVKSISKDKGGTWFYHDKRYLD